MPKFSGGTHINKIRKRRNRTLLKYIRISAGPQRGKYLHRMLVEARLGRELREDEEIDHEDGNTLNNAPSNLSEPMTTEQHNTIEAERRRRKREEQTRKETKVKVKFQARSGATDFEYGANES